MEDFEPAEYGRIHAQEYDSVFGSGSPGRVVDTIAEIVGDGTVMELAIGTGRIALPLARRGVRMSGIDASPEMLAKLKEKPGGHEIPVIVGDMADLPAEAAFDHAILVFNSLFCLLSQEKQVRCFEGVASRLTGGGTFVVEAFVPDMTRFAGHQALRTERVERDEVSLEAIRHDPVRQRIEVQTIRIGVGGVRLSPLPLRYAWPAEIDLMARLAGLRLAHRWSDWDRARFTADSRMHVSVYAKPGR